MPLIEMFGRGATVPLLGFGNAMAKGVKEAIAQKGFIGILEGGFASGAVGVSTATILGIIASVIAKPKMK